ncbi:MAG: PEGA domain-containing protein [Gemmatimonadetes bacterium]|nr:PEGA domain-containing protein [Gemmatimonadota bacterium]
MKRLIPLFFVTLATTACGTLFNSKIKTVSMLSNPGEAEVWIDGTMRGTTPLTAELDNQTSHTVVFRKEGHSDVVCELTATTGTLWVVLDILGGLLPVIVDAATGDWKGISQNVCDVVLPTAPRADASGEAGAPESALTEMANENGWVVFR